MKATLTTDGAKRLARPDLANQEVEIADVRTMPWGTRNATVIFEGEVIGRSMHLFTEGRHDNQECALIEI